MRKDYTQEIKVALRGSKRMRRVLISGTRLSGFLGEIDFMGSKEAIKRELHKKFSDKIIFYKPHYHNDTDLEPENATYFPSNIPAEFFLEEFDTICFFDSTTIFLHLRRSFLPDEIT